MNDRSGNVSSADPLVSFFYILLRDHLPAGVVEEIVEKYTCHDGVTFSNGWLADYAKDLATRLRK